MNAGGVALLVVFGFGLIRWLQARNDKLFEQLNQDKKESERNLLEALKESNEKHNECMERYSTLLNSNAQVIANNTHAIERLGDKLKT